MFFNSYLKYIKLFLRIIIIGSLIGGIVLSIIGFTPYHPRILQKLNDHLAKKNFNTLIIDAMGSDDITRGRGLGNQFFAFAISYAYAKKFNIPNLLVDNLTPCDNSEEVFKSINQRCYALDHFGINYPVMYNNNGLNEQQKKSTLTIKKVKQLSSITHILDLFYKQTCSIIKIPAFFKKNIYHQFKDHATEIKEILKYQHPGSINARKILKEIQGTNSVAMHIRRGDFVDCNRTVPLEYYLKAAYTIIGQVLDPVFFIFTDDLEYVKNSLYNQSNFKLFQEGASKEEQDLWEQTYRILNEKVIYVSAQVDHSLEQFHLMSKCKHNIISNSTFSWWAAFLNNNQDKIVVSPKAVPKYQPGPPDDENWIVLDQGINWGNKS